MDARVAPMATNLALDTRLVQHEACHIGQVALLRRRAGLPAMRYR